MRARWGFCVVAILLTGCAGADSTSPTQAPEGLSDVTILETLDRDPRFTQGLELLDDGTMVHSRGLYGESGVDILSASGEVLRSAELPDDEFGEGVTVVPIGPPGSEPGATAYQLTWKSGTVHTWSLPDLVEGPSLQIDGEGWGICYDVTRDLLWQSDGSSTLHSLAVPDLSVLGTVDVTAPNGVALDQLNELECVDGMVWANVWKSANVVQINPETGDISAVIDLSDVVAEQAPDGAESVLNGMAYDDRDGTFVVTGKNWDELYRVTFDGF
ncbi:MAG: glutaminyl-peptide cyclotransferase [Ornithinimicrobium sp.]